MPHKDQKVHRAYHLEYQRTWRKKNIDKARLLGRESAKAYRKKNPVLYRNRLESTRDRYTKLKHVSKRRKIDLRLTFEEYAAAISTVCHYCHGHTNKTGCGLDRINNEPYYSVENVVPCCGRCNKVFNVYFSYEEKLILAKAIRECDSLRRSSHAHSAPPAV